MRNSNGRGAGREGAPTGGASRRAPRDKVVTETTITPLSNTGVNNGVAPDERGRARGRGGKFEAASLANDAELREFNARVIAAADLLAAVMEAFSGSALKRKDAEGLKAYASCLLALSTLRGVLTSAAERQGVHVAPIPEHVAFGLRTAQALIQSDARMELASHSSLEGVSQAKKELLQ